MRNEKNTQPPKKRPFMGCFFPFEKNGRWRLWRPCEYPNIPRSPGSLLYWSVSTVVPGSKKSKNVAKFLSRCRQVATFTAKAFLHRIWNRKKKYVSLIVYLAASYLTFVLTSKIIMKFIARALASSSPKWIYWSSARNLASKPISA